MFNILEADDALYVQFEVADGPFSAWSAKHQMTSYI